MNFILTAPVYIMMLFSYDYHGYQTSRSYVVKDRMTCVLATADRHMNNAGSVGFCTEKINTLTDAQYLCGGEHVQIENPCLQRLPDDLVFGPYGAVLYGIKR